MSTYTLNRAETVEIASSQIEHIQGQYNGWTLAVDSVTIRFSAIFEQKKPSYSIKITLNCSRVNKTGKRGATRVGEDFWGSRDRKKPTPVPRWVLAILLDHKPAWFEGKLSELFEGTDRCTTDTANGPLLTWRAPR